MKKSRNILNFLALNRFVARNSDLKSAGETGSDALNISNETFISFFSRLIEHNVKFLVSGGIASAFHGHIKPVAEVEIWLAPEKSNTDRFSQALNIEKFRSPLTTYIETSTDEGFKLLISNSLSGFEAPDFDQCYAQCERATLENVHIPILNLNHLLAEKLASGRSEDKIALLALEKSQKV